DVHGRDRAAVDAAGLVDVLHRELDAVAHRLSEDGRATGCWQSDGQGDLLVAAGGTVVGGTVVGGAGRDEGQGGDTAEGSCPQTLGGHGLTYLSVGWGTKGWGYSTGCTGRCRVSDRGRPCAPRHR